MLEATYVWMWREFRRSWDGEGGEGRQILCQPTGTPLSVSRIGAFGYIHFDFQGYLGKIGSDYLMSAVLAFARSALLLGSESALLRSISASHSSYVLCGTKAHRALCPLSAKPRCSDFFAAS